METINVKHLQDQCDHTVLCPHNDDNDAANATTTTTKVTLKDWQENKYLQLPCYDEFNVDENGRSVWPEIIKSLNHMCEAFDEDGDSIHIEFSIKKYHPKFKNRLYFQHLHEVFDEVLGIRLLLLYNIAEINSIYFFQDCSRSWREELEKVA